MKKVVLLFFLILIALRIEAQEGAPLLTNFKESTELENQSWAICQDDNNVMLFANRRGILTFDGQGWNSIPIPTIPYSLKYNPKERKVYVGGDNNYGYLSRDDKGVYRYYSISGDTSAVGTITRILFTDSTVYFYSEQSISRHNIKTGKLELRLLQKENKPFSGMFISSKNTFINVLSEGLYRLESDTLFPIVTGYLSKDYDILFSLPYDNNRVLLGKSNGDLSLFDGIKYYDYQIKDENYLHQNVLSEGLTISDSLYAFSTLEGGALVIDRKSGKLKSTINYINGLPDDEVFALGVDNNNGLWLSHQYGLTRADLSLPVANFSIYPGLKGNLISSIKNNDELYVATSEGVYYLSEVKNYAEVEILVNNEEFSGRPGRTTTRIMPVPLQVQEPQKTRKSIFSQIFGKKPVAPVSPANQPSKAITEQNQVIVTPPEMKLPEPKYFKKVAGRLKSINYIYKKVVGLDEKCKQLVNAGDEILASTNRGLFSISHHKAEAIVTNGYINYISNKSIENRYYVATALGYFYIIRGQAGKWDAVYPDKTFIHPLYSIVSTDGSTFWAGSDDIAFIIGIDDGLTARKPVNYSVKNELPQRYILQYVNDTVFLFTLSKIWFYDRNSDSFVGYENSFLSNDKKLKFVFSQPEIPWVKTED